MGDFKYFEQRVRDCLNIDLSNYKPKQMQRRILSRMRRSGFENLESYAQGIETDPVTRDQFLDHITINVTEFFRNREHFERLDLILRDSLKERQRFKVWSAACSHGAEAFTLAMMLSEHDGLTYSILGTDIDSLMLEKSTQALYQKPDLKGLSPQEIDEYLDWEVGGYRIKKSLRTQVSFERHDLLQDPYPDQVDLIVCRNVLIYFTPTTQYSIFEGFHQALNPGGLLFIGATESLNDAAAIGFKKRDNSIFEKI